MCVCSLSYNNLGADGAKHLSEGLAKNETLTALTYAAAHLDPLLLTLTALALCLLLAHSLNSSALTKYGMDYSGFVQLAGALRQNGSLTSLSCVALPPLSVRLSSDNP